MSGQKTRIRYRWREIRACLTVCACALIVVHMAFGVIGAWS